MMKSLLRVLALAGCFLTSAGVVSAAQTPASQPAAGSSHTAPALILLAQQQSDRQKCVVAIKLCWQQCKSQYPKYSDPWKACRAKCGNPGNCD